MENYEELIGKNIKEVRQSRGLSQEVLSDMCGFSNTTLSAYEKRSGYGEGYECDAHDSFDKADEGEAGSW